MPHFERQQSSHAGQIYLTIVVQSLLLKNLPCQNAMLQAYMYLKVAMEIASARIPAIFKKEKAEFPLGRIGGIYSVEKHNTKMCRW